MKSKYKIKDVSGVTFSIIFACISAIFSTIYIENTDSGFILSYGRIINIIIVSILCIIAVVTVVSFILDKEVIYKFGVVIQVTFSLFSIIIYILNRKGILDKFDSIEDLREFISSYGGLSVLLFILVQILQVMILPIPGIVSIGAGVLLFGVFLGAVLSFIGVMIGSVGAFYIGRKLGNSVVAWLIGKDNLNKALNLVKGKDQLILSFMLIFPFFPDDLLCFVSGLSSMSNKYFFAMITITRFISIFSTAYSVSGSFIPFNTWWGILIWLVIILLSIFIVKVVYKHSEKIEKFFKRIKKS